MEAAAAFPFARAAAALGAYERNARDVARWAHPSPELGRSSGADPNPNRGPRVASCSPPACMAFPDRVSA